MKLNEAAGWLGMATILVVYALTATGQIPAEHSGTHVANFTGGLLLAWNSFYNRAWPVGTLNVTWSLVAAYGLLRVAAG
ncbi:MAG: hypothetical protein WD226_01690 [Planctomycetota bacterium]